MIENSKATKWISFRQKVNREDVKKLFPDYYWKGSKPEGWDRHIKDDWDVEFRKSTFRGYACYYIVHSSIEYIWIQTDYVRSAYSKRRWPGEIDWEGAGELKTPY
jgi:hypothetical protein